MSCSHTKGLELTMLIYVTSKLEFPVAKQGTIFLESNTTFLHFDFVSVFVGHTQQCSDLGDHMLFWGLNRVSCMQVKCPASCSGSWTVHFDVQVQKPRIVHHKFIFLLMKNVSSYCMQGIHNVFRIHKCGSQEQMICRGGGGISVH